MICLGICLDMVRFSMVCLVMVLLIDECLEPTDVIIQRKYAAVCAVLHHFDFRRCSRRKKFEH